MVARTDEELKETLFSMLSDDNTGMLMVETSGQHPQPMTHFVDTETKTLWFITHRDTDLIRAVGLGGQGLYTMVDTSDGIYASMRGPISQSDDRQKMADLWSPVVGAWFHDGPEDPDAVLIRLDLSEAAVWHSVGSLRFGFEIAKANMADTDPDVGSHTVLNFSAAA